MGHRLLHTLVPPAAAIIGFAAMAAAGAAQNQLPRLRYEPPADLLHSALRPPENYESTRINASLQVYDFRPAPPDIAVTFRQTLLREWIAPDHQEMQLVAPPMLGTLSVAGADAVYTAQFAEAGGIGPKPRFRVLIVARGSAAIIDAQAASMQAWPVAVTSFNALMSTLRVDVGPTSSSASTPATRAFAGLYVGRKAKFVSAIGPGVGAGSGGFVPALHMYLFSDTGRVYRAYDGISAPGNEVTRFDFDRAERADPVNSGRFVIQGNRVIVTMGERREETFDIPLRADGQLSIQGTTYSRTTAAQR